MNFLRVRGISLVEILISLAIFSTAMVGMYMSMNSVNASLAESMKRDIEASYANMLMSEVNPYDRLVESAYDLDSTEANCRGSANPGGLRCSFTTTDGNKIYYTRLVDSAATSADVKRINVYLYRSASGGTPYRKYRREIALKRVAFNLGPDTMTPLLEKDPSGQVWVAIRRTLDLADLTAGQYKAGLVAGANDDMTTADAITNAMAYTGGSYSKPWQTRVSYNAVGSNTLTFKYPATQGQTCTVSLGFAEINDVANGSKTLTIEINDQVVETGLDPFTASGGHDMAVIKTYTAQPMTESGVSILKVEIIDTNATFNYVPFLNLLIIERS